MLGVSRRVDNGSGLFPGSGVVVALVEVVFGLPLVEAGLVLDAAVAALHPDGHAVGGSGFLHLKEGVAGHGLQRLVDGGGRAALLGVESIVVRHLAGVIHQHHQRVGQHGAGLVGGEAKGVGRRSGVLGGAHSGIGDALGRHGDGGRSRSAGDDGTAGEQEGDAACGDAEHHGKASHPADGTAASAAAHLGAGEAPTVRMRSGGIHNGPSFLLRVCIFLHTGGHPIPGRRTG